MAPSQGFNVALLPPELLRRVLQSVLAPGGAPPQPLPLLEAAQLWFSLRLTCKDWAAVLEDTERPLQVAVEACVPPPTSLDWLQVHATALHLVPPDWRRFPAAPPPPPAAGQHQSGARGRQFTSAEREDAAQQDAEREGWMARWLTTRCGHLRAGALWPPTDEAGKAAATAALGPLSGDPYLWYSSAYEEHMERLARGLIAAGSSSAHNLACASGLMQAARVLDLSACRSLQDLRLTCPDFKFSGPPRFDTAPLAGLPRLRQLALTGFSEADLAGLPPSLRVLHFVGGERGEYSEGMPDPGLFAIPEDCSLDSARVLYRGMLAFYGDWEPAVGDLFRLPLPLMWRACRQLEVDAAALLLGDVPGDAELQESQEVGPVLDLLLPAMRGGAPLRRLALDADACFVLPSGRSIPARLLATLAGQQQLQAAGAGGWLEVQEGDSEDIRLPASPLEQARGQLGQPARRVVFRSTAAA